MYKVTYRDWIICQGVDKNVAFGICQLLYFLVKIQGGLNIEPNEVKITWLEEKRHTTDLLAFIRD